MTLNEFNDRVARLKRQPIYLGYVAGIDVKEVIKACRAWMNTPVRFVPSTEGEVLRGPWAHTEFDKAAFAQMADSKTPYIFKYLANANLIYPDGTFNLEILKEAKHGKRKPGKKKGDHGGESDGGV